MFRSLLLPIVFYTIGISSLSAQILPADSLVLVDIYNATDGSNWVHQQNWLSGPIVNWEGIKVANGRVVEIRFSRAMLKNTLPDKIYDLDALRVLDMNEPALAFHFSDRVSEWPDLEKIYLTFGELTGTLENFCSNSKLKEIGISSVDFTGTIPPCIAQLALTRFNVNNCQLDEAALPAFLSNVNTLTSIALSGNKFIGSIPPSWCNLTNLQFLVLSNNALTGEVPSCLNSGNTYKQLLLENNQLSGEFPTAVLGDKIGIFRLSKNDFTGDVGQWPYLNGCYVFEIDDNQFRGVLDGDIWNKEILLRVRMQNNQIEGILNSNNWGRLNHMELQGNKLDFEDLEQIEKPQDFLFHYAPQDSLGMASQELVNTGMSYTFNCNAGGSNTIYEWYKDGQLIVNANTPEYTISNLKIEDEGKYHCAARNDSFPDLTLVSRPVQLVVTTVSTRDFEKANWKIWPNPTQNAIDIEGLFATRINPQDINLFDVNGKKYAVDLLEPSSNGLRISVGSLPAGIYTLVVTTEKQNYAASVVLMP